MPAPIPPTSALTSEVNRPARNDESIADTLTKLLRAPDELRAAGAPDVAIVAAEEIARQASRLLAALEPQ